MNKFSILILAALISGGVWAVDYDYCNANLSSLDNYSKSECISVLKDTHTKTMNNLMTKILKDKTISATAKNITQESQKLFLAYKSKQCSMYENTGASADGLIQKELCEIGFLNQRNQFLEYLTN